MENFNFIASAIGSLLAKRYVCLAFCMGLVGVQMAQTPSASLEPGASPNEKVLFVEAEGGGDWVGNHLTISFTGDFSAQSLNIGGFTINWQGSWFENDPNDLVLQWHVNSDSTIATLEVEKADQSNSTGSGHFFTITHPGGIDILLLDGILKRAWGSTLDATFRGGQLTAYPVPCRGELSWVFQPADAATMFEIRDVQGKLLSATHAFGLDISHLPSGVYVLRTVQGNQAGGVCASTRFIKE
jgi:hypothetical protein